MEENIPQPQIQTQWYSSLAYALGPDAPWLRHLNHVAMGADGGSCLGPQVVSQSNELNNQSWHDGGAISKTDDETPVETVEELLDDAPVLVPVSKNLASLFNTKRKCKLFNPRDTRRPCRQTISTRIRSRSRHVMLEHIGGELSKIRSGELEMEGAELLISEKRVRRAEEYEWVCPAPECTMATLDDAELERHVLLGHHMKSTTPFRRRGYGHDEKTFVEAVLDILTADGRGGESEDAVVRS